MNKVTTVDSQLQALLDERETLKARIDELHRMTQTYEVMRDLVALQNRLDRMNYEIRALQALYP